MIEIISLGSLSSKLLWKLQEITCYTENKLLKNFVYAFNIHHDRGGDEIYS